MMRSRFLVSLVSLTAVALVAGPPRLVAGQTGQAPGPSAGPAPTPPQPPSDADLRARFSGVFNYAGGQDERAALDAAIDRAAQEFNFLFRPIVRSKLHDTNSIAHVVTFQWAPGSMRVTFTDPARDYRAPDDGTPVHDPKSKDASTRISHRFERGNFIEQFTADEGAQRNVFTLTSDAQKLTMNVLVTSPKLKNPIQYNLTYHR
jgi:hypothetical protein